MILVGVDGSAGGRRALRFAVREARLRGTSVLAISVLPEDGDGSAAEQLIKLEVGQLLDDLGETDRAVEVEIRHGDAANVLIALSDSAELLVVGSHRTSSLIHSALGSVSAACAQLAGCPVVVIPVGGRLT